MRTTKTPLQKLKAQMHGRRFWVIAQQYPTAGLKVAAHFDGTPQAQEERARLIFKGQYATRNERFTFKVGVALCNVSRVGNISWGLFEPL